MTVLVAFYISTIGAISFENGTSDDYKRGFCDGYNLVASEWAKHPPVHAYVPLTCLEKKR